MNWWLYSIDWWTLQVRVIGGFAGKYHAELARDRFLERATEVERGKLEKYFTLGIAPVNPTKAAAFTDHLNSLKNRKDAIENAGASTN